MKKKWLLHIILIFFISRILILSIVWLSVEILPQKNIENLPLHLDTYKTSEILRASDSGGWQQSLIKNGYTEKEFSISTQENWGFFPLWAILIKGLSIFTNHQLILEFIVTNLFFLTSLIVIFKFCKDHLSKATGYYTCIFFSIIPFNYVFMALNPMSLSLMLSILTLNYGFRKKWLKAGIASFFASLTFVQGILLLVPMLWLYMEDKKWEINKIKWDILPLSLCPIGLLLFMLYLKNITGNPLAFADIQIAWGNSGKWPFYNLIEFIKNPAIINHYGWSLGIYNFFLTTSACLLTIWIFIDCHLKKFNWAYLIYTIPMILLLISRNSMMGNYRYVLLILPLFLFISFKMSKKPILASLVLSFMALISGFVLVFAGNGYYAFIA